MSIFTDFLEKITGLDLDGSDSQKTVNERPCSNCPSNCAIAGAACSVCEPYKKKLIDAVYHIDHIDEYYAQYEVVSTPQTASGGMTHCPCCGANSANPYTCEYCGAKLSEAPVPSGKIQVSAASEIPNPIMDAQDIIWERYDTVVKQYASTAAANSSVKGSLIGDLFSELIGTGDDDEEESPLGAMMSEAEIKEVAALYGVSVGDYLTGLDNGKYLTLNGKKEADAQGVSASSVTPASIGLPGMAAVGGFASNMFAGSPGYRRPESADRRPVKPAYKDTPEHMPERPSRMPSAPEQKRPSASSFDRDVLERPAQSGPSRKPSSSASSSVRRPSDYDRPAAQRSGPSGAGNNGPSHERHPENRRTGRNSNADNKRKG